MIQMTTVILIAVWFSSFCNALFFGLFNSKQTSKPDLVISNSKLSDTDRTAYEQYIRSIERLYPIYTQVRYVPFYVYQPIHPKYIQPYSTEVVYYPPDSIYHSTTIENEYHNAASISEDYSQEQATPSASIPHPIVVLPLQQPFESLTEKTQGADNHITSSTSNDLYSKSVNYFGPDPQIPTTLYDLPNSNSGPDFRTGGYLTKPLAVKPRANSHSDRKNKTIGTKDLLKIYEKEQ